jgi:hypothetical protein
VVAATAAAGLEAGAVARLGAEVFEGFAVAGATDLRVLLAGVAVFTAAGFFTLVALDADFFAAIVQLPSGS